MAGSLKQRVQAFDWLRGLAVLFMVQCHALALLTPERHTDAFFRWLVRSDGLVAPSFIFSAGFSLALVQVRGAANGPRWIRALKTLRRLVEVLLVAELVNWAWFPVFKQARWLIRMDILHSIGLSLMLALPLMVLLARKPLVLRWVALGLAGLVFGISPLLEHGLAPFDWAFNNTPNGCGADCTSVFPLLPWAGYVYLGASAGATAASTDLRGLTLWLTGIGLVSALVWTFSPFFLHLYPPHNFWVTNPANAAQRVTLVMALLLGLLALEHRVPAFAKSLPIRALEVYGTSSMAAYFFHEMLLFFRFPLGYLTAWGFSINQTWGGKCGWGGYAIITVVVLILTWGLAWVTDKLYKRIDARLPSLPKPAPAPSPS